MIDQTKLNDAIEYLDRSGKRELADVVRCLMAQTHIAEERNECIHAKCTPHYTHVSCNECGSICTDGDWGIASRMWFKSEEEAHFYQKNGYFPSNQNARRNL